MGAYVRLIYDKIEFIEFKQSILFLKQPQHKASIFQEMNLDDFLKIRDYTKIISEEISNGKKYNFEDYESELFSLWPLIKSYPSASTLVAKALMSEDIYNSLFSNNN